MLASCLAWWSSVLSPCAHAEEPPIDLRLHIAWGGGANQAWQGSLRITDGEFETPRSLGQEADDVASVEFDGGGVIRIAQRTRSPYGGIDVTLRGNRTAELNIELAPTDRPAGDAKQFTISLSDLIAKPFQADLDNQKTRLLVSRAPGDRLRVRFERDSLVFSPDEKFDFDVLPHLTGLEPGTSLRCRAQLQRARSDDAALWTDDRETRIGDDGSGALVGPFSVPLPAVEGVYDIVIALSQKRLIDPFSPVKSKPLLQRRIQLVVIDTKPPPADTTAWKSIGDIDPAQGVNASETTDARWSDWLKRMPQVKVFPGFQRGPIGNGKAARKESGGRSLVQLEKDGWLAYPLPISKPDEPHLLEVQYPTDQRSSLGISLIEPNAAGRVTPLGLDSGVDVAEVSSESGLSRFRLIFWPRTKAPLVLFTNRRTDGPALFGRLSVFAGPTRLPSSITLPTGPSGDTPGRLLAAYFDKPLFPENFGAGEALDGPSQGTLDDWVTFYLGAKRLVEYLKFSGYNGAMISVACEGSAIYPSALLQPTPKYDTGIFFSTGQDPVRKDVVEMLLRMFDREKLRLVPMLQFSSPLPELETLRRAADPRIAGLEWIDGEGSTWLARYPTRRGLAPYYNPLHPSVRQAMRNVTAELAARYARHPSFAGIGLQLGPDTFAQLPGDEWGLDDTTIERFEQSLRGRVPGQGATRFADRAAFLRDVRGAVWADWRAAEMTDLYRSLQETTASFQPRAKLFLATTDMFSDPRLRQALRPALPSTVPLHEALQRTGLDVQRLSQMPAIVAIRPNRVAPIINIAAQAVNLEAAQSAELDRLFLGGGGAVATMHYHEMQPLRLESFDAVSPFGVEQTFTSLMSHLTPGGSDSRRRFAHSLATLDPQMMIDGGWMLPLGKEDATRSLFELFRQLPDERFETIAAPNGSSQPLVVRRLSLADRTLFYVVNDSRRELSAEIDLDVVAATGGASMVRGEAITLQRTGSVARWQIKLPPYGAQGVTIAAPGVRVQAVRSLVDTQVVNELGQRLNGIRMRTNAQNNPKPLTLLKNPGFETPASPQGVPGWVYARGANLQVAVDLHERFGGNSSLSMKSQGQVAWVRSEPFAVPSSGRIALTAWLKTTDPNKQPPLRLSIQGKLDDADYYRYATIGAGPNATPLLNEWKQYRFQVTDLPAQGLIDLRIGFDLMGTGEVFIDDVQIFDLWLTNPERSELLKRIAAADLQLERGEISDCERFLDSFWPRYLLQQIPLDPRVAREPSREPSAADSQSATDSKSPAGAAASPKKWWSFWK